MTLTLASLSMNLIYSVPKFFKGDLEMQIRSVAALALAVSSLVWSQSCYTAAVRGVITDRSGPPS
jgi:hypothetical protein